MVISNKDTSKGINSQIAISKARTNERTLPMAKKTRRTFRKKKKITKVIIMTAQITEKLEKEKKSDYYQSDKKQFHPNESINYFVGIPAQQIKILVCRRCSTEFYSNNKSHIHVKVCKTLINSKTFTSNKINGFHVSVIQSDVPSDNNPKLKFRFWHYATFAVFIKKRMIRMKYMPTRVVALGR